VRTGGSLLSHLGGLDDRALAITSNLPGHQMTTPTIIKMTSVILVTKLQ